MARAVASIRGEVFDRIRVADASDFASTRLALLEACRLADDNSLILVDRCERPWVVEAVYEALASALIAPARLPHWQYNVGQMLVRKHRALVGEEAKKTILVAIVGDQARAEWRLSRPSIAAYAARINADLVTFEDELTVEQRPLCKLMALDRVRGRGRVLMLDADMIVKDACPDLFAITPDDAVALFCESFWSDRSLDMLRISANYAIDLSTPCYANTGLMLLTPQVVDRLAISGADDPIYLGPQHEQDYINAFFQKNGFPVISLSPQVNCIVQITPELVDKAYVLHFAGGDSKNARRPFLIETVEPRTQRIVRAKSYLHLAASRLPMLRNAALGCESKTDIFLPAYEFTAPQAVLIASDDITRFDCPQLGGYAVHGPYVTLEPGHYAIDILLDPASCRAAFAGLEPSSTETADGSVEIDLICENGGQTIVAARSYSLARGFVSIAFHLVERANNFECRLHAPSRPFSFFGIRVRSNGPPKDPKAMIDIEMVDQKDVAAICSRALEFRSAHSQTAAPHALPKPLIVSLTSHYRRFRSLAIALTCLLRQTIKPDEVVLWLDPIEHGQLPADVLGLTMEGLTIRITEDLGPYTKVAPAMAAYPDAFIVVADDDKYYAMDWLEKLVDAWVPGERALLCNRAHRMRFDSAGNPLPYLEWKHEIETPELADDLFATGCGGILFPPGLLPIEVWDQEAYQMLSPTNDDIWINCMARLHGCSIRKVGGLFRVPDLPDTQDVALAHANRGGANDRQLRAVVERYGLTFERAS